MSRTGAFAATLDLARLFARVDRVRLTCWLLGLASLWSFWAASMEALYPTETEREGHARLLAGNAVARAVDGPASGSSLGAITMVESFAFMASLAALMSILLVVRHTRVAEEARRGDLTASGVVGRRASVAAALLVAGVANAALAVLAAGGLAAQGLDPAGSLAAGAALGAVGLVFAGVAAVTAQLAATARAARGTALGVLVTSFALRAAGDAAGRVRPSGVDVDSAWPSWLSPIGWGQQVRPFAEDHWWVLGLFAAGTAAAALGAFVLSDRREVDSGVLPPRARAASTGAPLRGPFTLALRVQRGALLATAAGIAVVSTIFGAIGAEADKFVGTSAEMAEALGRLEAPTIADAWFATTLGWVGAGVAAYAVHALLRLCQEEAGGLLEPALSTAVSRRRWLLGHTAVPLGAAGALLLLAGVCAGLAFAAAGGASDRIGPVIAGAAVQWPAVVVLGGLAVAAFGLAPRLAPALSWSALAVAVVLGPLGRLLDLSPSLVGASPLGLVPPVPAADLDVVPLAALLAVGALLLAAGSRGFRRRDLLPARPRPDAATGSRIPVLRR